MCFGLGYVLGLHSVAFFKYTVKPLIKDTPKEDKSPNKGQAESTLRLVYTLYRKSPLKEDNLCTEDKMAGPDGVLIKSFRCTQSGTGSSQS